MKQVTTDPMMLADLRTPQPREVRLGLIDVRPIFGIVLDTVIDAANVVGRVQPLPKRSIRLHG